MARKDVYNFAMKWIEKFQDPDIDYIELVDHNFADDCDALGFYMDCGNSFGEKFGRDLSDDKELDSIIENINDISLLGSDPIQPVCYSCSRLFVYANKSVQPS